MSLVKRIFGKDAPPMSADSQSQTPSSSSASTPAAFDNDADFISFDNDNDDDDGRMPALGAGSDRPEPSQGFNIKGRAAMSRQYSDEDAMDLDGGSSSDDALPKGIEIIRSRKDAGTPNAQGTAISATHVLPSRPPTGPTYTGGYDSPLGTSSPINIRGTGESSTLPPPPQKYLSHNLNTTEASSSASTSRDRKKDKDRTKRSKKRKADAMSDGDDVHLMPIKGGEYLPWVKEVEWFNEDVGGPAGILKLFNQETRAAARWLAPTRNEHDAREMLVSVILDVIKREFRNDAPFMDVEPFGSHVNRLYLPGGDIDIVIVKDSIPNRLAGGTKGIRTIFQRIISALRYHRIVPSGQYNDIGVQMILQARCPIVKLKTIQGNISVDISIYDDGGIRASRLVGDFLRQYPVARDLVLLVKAYMRKYKINEVFMGGLGSYSTFCLVISFLQHHASIQNRAIDPQRNLGVLFQEFFDTYAEFEWDTYGISLRDGGSLFRKASRGWIYGHQNPRNIAIEDPQDASNNISKGSTSLNQIFTCWARAVDILDHNIAAQEEKWKQYKKEHRPRIWVDSRDEWDPTKMSMLKDVIGFRTEMLDQRRALEDLYWSGELQRMLNLPMPSSSKGSSRGQHSRFDDDETRKQGDSHAKSSSSHQSRSSREEDKYVAIHMNDDPHAQHVTDNSDDELQYLDRLAKKGNEKNKNITPTRSERKALKRAAKAEKTRLEQLGRRAKASAGPTPGSKEAEMGLDDDELDGGMNRPIEVDDYDDSDEDVVEIVDGSGVHNNEAQPVRYQDTLPSDRDDRAAKRIKRVEEREKKRDSSRQFNGDGSSGKMNAEERRKYWADKGPREAGSPPARPPPKGPKKSHKSDQQQDRSQPPPRQQDKEEDFSNLGATAGDAIAQNADFVSFNF